MRRTLFVHVGATKTGTTSIQNMLDRWQVALRRSGVRVPITGRMKGRTWLDADAHWANFRNELRSSRAPRVVVSNERWTSVHMNEYWAHRFAALAEALDIDVKVVGYVRPQYQLLESLFCQRVKMGTETAPFQTVFDSCAARYPELDCHRLFGPWRQAFGDRLSVYPLEPARMPDGVVAHFLGVIGAGDLVAAAADLPRTNRRPGAKFVEVLRLASVAGGPHDSPIKIRSWKYFWLEPVRRGLAPLLEDDVPFAGLSPAQVRTVTKLFAESNARFAREYGIDAGGSLFREPVDAHVRPACAEWTNLSEAERQRVRQFVRDAVGVDLQNGQISSHVVSSLPRALAIQIADRVATGTHIHHWIQEIENQWRNIRGPRDAIAFLGWLLWDLEVLFRFRKVWMRRIN